MKKIRFIAIALIAMMLLSLAPASMAESPKIVKVATSESIVKCDPHDQQGWPGRAAMRMVMETLVETDHEGNTTPLMAKSWEISEDNKEITFYLFDTKYAFKNALIPIVTIVGSQFGTFLGGSVVVECIFSWSGVGQMLNQAIGNRDYELVQGSLLLMAAMCALVFLLIDIINAAIDPRITLD